MNGLTNQVLMYGAYLNRSFQHTYLFCLEQGSNLHTRVTDRAAQFFHAVQASAWWQESLAPAHRRYIAPLEATEWQALGGALGLSALVVAALVHQLGLGALPLASGLATTCLVGVYHFVDKRAEKKLKQCLQAPLREMYQIAQGMSAPEFAAIYSARNKIKKEEERFFEECIKEIDAQIASFKQAMENPSHPKPEDAKRCFLLFLERKLEEIVS